MLSEVTNLINMEVYTHRGILLGVVQDVQVDTTAGKIYELLLTNTNPTMVEGSRNLGVPYRWV